MAKTSNKPTGLNSYIEHTVLKQVTTRADVVKLCEEAVQHQFLGVCVPPYFVDAAVKELKDSGIKVVTVIGFPLGYTYTSVKVEEAKWAVEKGADELDMVVNLAAFRSGDMNYVKNDIESVATIARINNKILKVIIESGILTDEEVTTLCKICEDVGVDIVKTSTGFAEAGASTGHVKLMRSVLPEKTGIKASGGIRDKAFTEELIAAGANRIGTSSGIKIMES